MKARVLGEVQKQLREGGFWQPLAVSPGARGFHTQLDEGPETP